jgi:hypothetical protein
MWSLTDSDTDGLLIAGVIEASIYRPGLLFIGPWAFPLLHVTTVKFKCFTFLSLCLALRFCFLQSSNTFFISSGEITSYVKYLSKIYSCFCFCFFCWDLGEWMCQLPSGLSYCHVGWELELLIN